MSSETPYVETEILLAVMSDDMVQAATLVKSMLPGERTRFRKQIMKAYEVVRKYE